MKKVLPRRGRRLLSFLLYVGVFSSIALIAFAQLPTATILGVVKDSSGAVVPDVALTARNVETGQTRTAVSGADGSYRFPALPVGNYEVRAEHPGFQAAVRSGLTLTVSQEAVVNFALEVGAVTQTVAVTAEAPLVNTTSGSLGGLVDEQKVADLPLNGRNYIDLTLLQPGVTQHRNVGANPNSGGLWYSSNGAPVYSNNYMLDGAPMLTLLGANSASLAGGTMGIDGIREFRVVTNAFSAEYGLRMGSQVVLVSKNGTNQFHGSVLEYLRNSALDARNFFDYKTAATGPDFRLPPYRRNQFGASLGGPIRKDKTFFLGVYEGLRQRLGLSIVDNVMGAGCHGPAGAVVWNGQGTQPAGSLGPCAQLGTNPSGPNTNSVTISPVTAPLLALYPNPNLPGNQFTDPFTAPTRDDFGQMRVDHTLSANDSLFVRYTIDDAEVTTGVSGSTATGVGGIQTYPGYNVNNRSRGQFATLSENHIFSATVLSTARFSYSRTAPRTDSAVPHAGPQLAFVPASSNELGTINIGGISPMGPHGTTPSYLPQNIFTWSDDLFYTRGKHSLKFGTLLNRFRLFDFTSRGFRGTATFANVANFLRAQAQQYTALTPGSNTARDYRYTSLGFYVQDDYRVVSNLTLNLGLRYEFLTQLHERYGIQAAFRDIQRDAAPTVGIPFVNPTRRNVSPRFGFGWDVKGDGKTAVRGGFALLYDIGTYGTTMNVIQPNAGPFSSNSLVVNPATFTIPFTFTPENIANQVSLFDYRIQQQHLLSYNLTVERQLPFSMAASLAFAGSRGINIIGTRDGNPTLPQGQPVNGICVARPAGQAFDVNQPYCWLGNDPYVNSRFPNSITLITAAANSFYNALQFGLTKRLSQGLQFQSSYTWSKLMDEPQAEATNVVSSSPVQPTDPFRRATDRGPSVFDVNHNWRFNAIYQVPQLAAATGVLGKVLNGWQVSSILSLQTGYPFTINLQTNRSRSRAFNSGPNIDRPNLAPGRSNENITSGTTAGCLGVAAGQKLGRPNLYYDPCAFTIPAAGFLGNAGRNILRGPGLANLDFSLVKNTPIHYLGESGRLEFRAEVFNILNRANFDLPARTVFAATADGQPPLPSAGVISSAATSRQIQFALKVLF